MRTTMFTGQTWSLPPRTYVRVPSCYGFVAQLSTNRPACWQKGGCLVSKKVVADWADAAGSEFCQQFCQLVSVTAS